MADHHRKLSVNGVTDTDWMTAEQVARLYGVSVWTVRRAVRAGRLRTREVLPGLVRIDPTSVPPGQFSNEQRW